MLDRMSERRTHDKATVESRPDNRKAATLDSVGVSPAKTAFSLLFCFDTGKT